MRQTRARSTPASFVAESKDTPLRSGCYTLFGILFVMAWLLTACDSAAPGPNLIPPGSTFGAPTATATAPTATAASQVQVQPSLAPTAEPSDTATPTTSPSATPTPTSTPLPTATSTTTSTPTRAPTNTPLPTATRVPPTDTPTAPPPTTSFAQGPYVRRLFVVPGNAALLFLLMSDNRFLRSENGGVNWSPVDYASTGMTSLTGTGIDYRSAKTIYLTGDKGIFRSDDEGLHWTLVNSLAGQGITVSLDGSNVLWTAVTSGRSMDVMRSTDGGKTWNKASNGFYGYVLSGPILIDPEDSNTLYAVSDGLRGGQVLFRGTRDGAWQPIPSYTSYGFCCFAPVGLAWSTNSHTLYAGSWGGKLLASTNAKEPDVKNVKWQTATDFGAQAIVSVLAHGGPGETLYASVYDTSNNKVRLLKSPDGGANWQDLTLP